MAARLKLATRNSGPALDAPQVEHALYYGGRGINVFPCWWVVEVSGSTTRRCACPEGAACKAPGKHPLLDAIYPGRDEYKNRASDDTYLTRASSESDQIRKLWARHPLANIGMACARSNLLVLDPDVRNGKQGPLSMRESYYLFGEKSVETVRQRTGSGGAQYFFRCTSKPNRFNADGLKSAHIDIKYNGHVILPPSFNDLGRYEWEQGASFDDLEPQPYGVLKTALTDGAEKLFIGEVGDRNTAMHRWLRNVKLFAKQRSHSVTDDRLEKWVREAADWRYDARKLGEPRLDRPDEEPFSRTELEKILRNVLDTPDRELKAEEAAFDLTGFDKLVQYMTDPPYWEISYDGVKVKVDTKTLFSWQLLRLRIGEVLRKVLPPTVKNVDWSLALSSLMQNCETVSAPDDASEAGMLRSYLVQFLKKVDLNQTGEVLEERMLLRRGIPIVHVREGVKGIAFGGGNFTRYLQMQYRFRMKQNDIWSALGKLGVEYFSLKVPNPNSGKATSEKVWFVPLDQVPDLLDEVPAPEFKMEI
jgi:hypothetical protein